MRIVWDEPKRLSNLNGRGLDFADLDIEFFAAAKVLPARHGRMMAIGRFRNLTLTVIFKSLGSEALSVVSMRPASDRERRLQ